MVIINLKISDKNQFLHETTTDCPIDKLIKDLVIGKRRFVNKLVNNLRVKVDLACQAIEDLMKFGPLKPEDVRGLKDTENLEPDIE